MHFSKMYFKIYIASQQRVSVVLATIIAILNFLIVTCFIDI
jgi:hypothetical protein